MKRTNALLTCAFKPACLSFAAMLMACTAPLSAYAQAGSQTEQASTITKDAKAKKVKKAKAPKLINTKPENTTLPGGQFKLEVSTTREVLPFRARVDGISDNQRQALDQVAARAGWAQDNPITLELITSHAPQSVSSALAIRTYLLAHGVAANDIEIGHVSDMPDDIVNLNVVIFAMKPIVCGQRWDNLAATFTNRPDNNFGCAITANLAAEINDPRQVLTPAASSPVDVNRRNVIMQKYREGKSTASEANDAANVKISSAVQ
jgi:pilus assembly protein CpaD